MYLVTAVEMQAMDRGTIESYGIPGLVLMENAGRGATRALTCCFEDIERKKVAVIAGRGNNGGDGFVIARYLSQRGVNVIVYLLALKEEVQGDAAANLRLLEPLDVQVLEVKDKRAFKKQQSSMRHQDLWVDAILGTGLNSDVKGYFKTVIEFINALNKPVFAVDIPSGLNADTGQVCGVCIRAQTTATFAFAKIGHVLYPGATYTGDLEVIDIGIPNFIAEQINPRQHLITAAQIAAALPCRPPDAHKGHNGHLLVVAGSIGKLLYVF